MSNRAWYHRRQAQRARDAAETQRRVAGLARIPQAAWEHEANADHFERMAEWHERKAGGDDEHP